MNVSPKLAMAFAIPAFRLEVRRLLRLMGHISEMEQTGKIHEIANAYSQDSICEFIDISDSLMNTFKSMEEVNAAEGNPFGAQLLVLKCELDGARQAVNEFVQKCKQNGGPA